MQNSSDSNIELVSNISSIPYCSFNKPSYQHDNLKPYSLQHIQDNHELYSQSYSTSAPTIYNQESFDAAEHSFFYRPCNDFQIYHITCKEISFEFISQLIRNNSSTHCNDLNSFIFYYQQPNNKKIYQVICRMVSHTLIVHFLNRTNYGIETNPNKQQQNEYLDFSNDHKANLEYHLQRSLIDYLPSNQINEQLNMNMSQDNLIASNFNEGIAQQDDQLIEYINLDN